MNDKLYYRGQTYELAEWLSLASYSTKYGIPLPTLYSRIKRGNIRADDQLVIEKLNLHLIRDQSFEAPGRGMRLLREDLRKRHEVVAGDKPNGWVLIDRQTKRVVGELEAGEKGEAIQRFNQDQYQFDEEGNIVA